MPAVRSKLLPDGKLQFEEPLPRRVIGYRDLGNGLWEPDFNPCEDRLTKSVFD